MVYWRPVPYSWNFGMFLMIDIYIFKIFFGYGIWNVFVLVYWAKYE